MFASPFPYDGRVGHIEVLDWRGTVAKRLRWDGQSLIQLTELGNARWVRVVVSEPGTSASISAVRGVGLMEGGSRYTIPWRPYS